jgi:hypothetical protein
LDGFSIKDADGTDIADVDILANAKLIVESVNCAERPQLSAEEVSEVFAKTVNNTDPEHQHIYDHRLAAELLNRLLTGEAEKGLGMAAGQAMVEGVHKGIAGVGERCCDSTCWCGGMPAAASGAPAKCTCPLVGAGASGTILGHSDSCRVHGSFLAAPPVPQAETVVERAQEIATELWSTRGIDGEQKTPWISLVTDALTPRLAAIRREAERAARLDEAERWATMGDSQIMKDRLVELRALAQPAQTEEAK